jgi:hypothetical protein
LDLLGIERIAGSRLDVVENVVLAQTPITYDIDAFDQPLTLL